MTMDLRLKAYTPNGASLGILPSPDNFSLAVPLNDTPSLTLNYGVSGPRSDVLGKPLELAVEVSGDGGLTWAEPTDLRFLYLRDGRDPAKTADTWQAEAPGYIWRLQKARVLSEGQATADGRREFTNRSVGYILATLWAEAQARGALAGMTLTGTAAVDASGVAWGTTISRSFPLGTDYLQILQDLAEAGLVDYRMADRTLRIYRPDTTLASDRTVGANQVQLIPVGISEAPFRRTWEGLADYLHVEGDEQASVGLSNGAASKPWGRWEDYITQGGVSDTGTLTALGQRYQALSAQERAEYTVGFSPDAGPRPLLDFWPGDYIWSRIQDGTRTRYRVRQVTLQKDGNTVQGNVVLNDRFLEADIRTRRALDAITGGASFGSSGGTPAPPPPPGSDILAPANVTGLSGTSASYLDGATHRAQFTLDWADVTTNADGTPITDLARYEIEHREGGGAGVWRAVTSVEAGTSLVTLSPYLPGSLWEFRVRAVDTSGNLSLAWSNVATVTGALDTVGPAKPSKPTVTTRAATITIEWDGLTSAGGAMDQDLERVEVHIFETAGETPVPGNAGSLVGVLGNAGSVTASGMIGGDVQYARLLPIDTAGNAGTVSDASLPVTVAPLSDGIPPFTSPTPEVLGGIGVLHVRWSPTVNADPVTYDVHVSATSGFAPSSATLVSSVVGTALTVRRLAGVQTDTYNPNLAYDTTYYVKLVARDPDGTAPAGAQGSAKLTPVTGPDVAAHTIQGENIVGGSLTGDLFSGTLVLGSTISTGAIDEDPASATYGEVIGQRVDIDTAGIRLIDPAGKPVVNIPTDPGTEASFTGEVIAKGLTVQQGATFESKFNEISRDGALNLSVGTSSPVNAPSPVITWDQLRLDVTTKQDGELGNFALNPAQVGASGQQVPSFGGLLMLAQNVTGGCRIWYMSQSSGLHFSHDDLTGFRITGIVHVVLDNGSGIPAFIGEYTGGQWYVWTPNPASTAGMYNKYNRLNTNQDPNLGWDATAKKLMVIENDTPNDRLVVRRLTPNATDNGLGTFTSTNFAANTELESARPACILYGTFDYGVNRYITSPVGNSYAVRSYNSSGVEQTAELWSSAAGSKRSVWWSGTKFGTLDSDGTVYWYTDLKWTATSSDKWWMGLTWYDSDPLGTGTHETTLGKVTSVNMKKRAKLTLSIPPVPDYGATDDPDKWRLYMTTTDNATTPASTSYHLQATDAVTQYPVFAVNMAGAAPPTLNNFGGANPGYIRSGANRAGDATLAKFQVDGAGAGRFDGLIPPASLMMWAGAAAPAGWLICDGSTRNIADYPDLYANLGGAASPFGVTSTTFTLPDMRSRFPVGVGTYAARGAGENAAETVRSPSHDHNAGTLATDTYTHTRQTFYAASGATGGLQGPAGHSHSVTGRTGSGAGNGAALESRFPYLGVYFIIKT